MIVESSGGSRCEALRKALGCQEDELLGESEVLVTLLDEVRLTSRRKVRVLLTGPTGVGKTTVAHILHRASGRKGPFVAINAAQLPAGLADSLLFGHERGAYTDAHARADGLVALADQGTLFIDEVAELDPSVQAKLLTFLDTGRYRGLGMGERSSDVRLLTATNRPLDLVRVDLVERLAQFTIAVPPLSERPGDILPLAGALLQRIARSEGVDPLRLAPDGEEALLARVWPGNVRQLERVLLGGDIRARAGDSPRIRGCHLFPGQDLPAGALSFRARMLAFRRVLLRDALEAKGGRANEAAALLGIARATLYLWMTDLSL